MNNRLKFNEFLKTITPNVYFQPPTNISIKYPCIIYTRKDIEKVNANNGVYRKNHAYDVTIIDRNPDSPIASKLIDLRYCEFDRQFIKDGLNHISFKIYY